MNQLSVLQSITLLIGAFLMVVGVGLAIFAGAKYVGPWMFFFGAILFSLMQFCQRYQGESITIIRLRRILIFSNILFILSALLLLENSYLILFRGFLNWFENGYTYYMNFIHNNWVVVLLLAAVLEVYSTHRISKELKKEEGEN